ncbi:MAG: FliM/FliN family flagellar motor switch protein [Deferribacterota bacterium]|nr:FliM/FliN family flagellar motor switch protein [Deferribacterota bacterium]
MNNFIEDLAELLKEQIEEALEAIANREIEVNITSSGVFKIDMFSEKFMDEAIAEVYDNIHKLEGGFFFIREDLIGLSNIMLTGEYKKEQLFSDEKIDAALELLRQITSSINVPFYEKFGEKIDLKANSILNVDERLVNTFKNEYIAISFSCNIDSENIGFVFFINSKLEDHVGTNDAYKEEGGTGARNIDMLLDIEVPVAVKIGTTKVYLKDLLNFTSGNVIELKESVNEPVELVVNNKTIAYGEVVVADGYFGLKIKEILKKDERIKHLADKEV